MPAELQLRGRQILEGAAAQVVDPSDVQVGVAMEGGVLERGAAPEPERAPQERCRALVAARGELVARARATVCSNSRRSTAQSSA